jgi:hypothetical protein
MHFARKLLLLAIAAIAAMAFMAAPASATDTVTVVSETTGANCGTAGTSSGGCAIHGIGTASLLIDLGIFGEASEAICNLEMEMRIGGNGTGRIDALEHASGPDANCATVMTECSLPWPTSGEEDGTAGVMQSSATVCIDPSEGDICQGNFAFDLVEQSGEHVEIRWEGWIGRCEIHMDQEIEAPVPVHINHP